MADGEERKSWREITAELDTDEKAPLPSQVLNRPAPEGRSPRRKFAMALVGEWERARDVYLPAGPKTRDEQYVWEALRRARTEDIWALEDKSPCLVIPCDPSVQWQNVEPTERVKMGPNDTVRAVPLRTMTPELTEAWLAFHSTWVKAELSVVVDAARQRLSRAKRERSAELRRSRKQVTRRGRRVTLKRPGPRPSIKVQLPRIGVSRSAPKKSSTA